MSLNSDHQKLEPGNAVRLFDVDGTALGVSDVLHFHTYNIAHIPDEIAVAGGDDNKLPAKSIQQQGQEYKAWPCQIEGIETATDRTSAQPTLSVVNLDSPITALCLAYDDLLQTKVTIHDVLAQCLDAKNYPEGNPSADPQQGKLKVFYIDAKSIGTNELVAFTLLSPMGLQGLMIPTRQLHSLCTWCIRNKHRSGDGCDYARARYFNKHNNPVNDLSLDERPGTLTAYKLRHGEGNGSPFGGFPDTSLIRSWYASGNCRRHYGARCC